MKAIKAYVLIVTDPGHTRQVYDTVRAIEGVVEAHEVMGPYDIVAELAPAADLATIARALAPMASNLTIRAPESGPHCDAINAARKAVRNLVAFPLIERVVGAERVEPVMILMLVIADRFAAGEELNAIVDAALLDPALASELAGLRAQLAALWTVARP